MAGPGLILQSANFIYTVKTPDTKLGFMFALQYIEIKTGPGFIKVPDCKTVNYFGCKK